ncbi:MAG: hypothetical protein M3380_06835 [Chloroflexota bacterium]|nr:hypothetical protein [Chloroflexota bacterium]
MENTAQHVSSLDRTIARRTLTANWAVLIDALMRPRLVVVLDIRGQHTTKMLLPKHDDPVKAFLSNGTNPPFGERIGIGSPHWRPDDPDIV